MTPRFTPSLRRAAAACALAATLAGCATLASWIPSIPAPNFGSLFAKSKKPDPLPELFVSATAQPNWQVSVGRAAPGIEPAVSTDAIYAAASDGTVVRLDPANGRTVWRASAGKPISAGPGAGREGVVVATAKGEVIAFDPDGKTLWTAQVSSEVNAPPIVSEGMVIVVSGDGRVFGLAVADGKTRWVYSRANPPLVVRNYSPGVASRGGAFLGFAGGRLVALDIPSGNVGWDATVAIPRGATELERVADVTSRPLVDDRQVCAVAFQGRVACFEIVRGTIVWARDISSLAGIASDEKYLYVTDDKGAVHALDRTTGASIWKQDKLAGRRVGGPQLVGDYVGVVDVEGYLHLISRGNGAYVGRLATDGSAATGQPLAILGNAVWQSSGGTVYSVSAR